MAVDPGDYAVLLDPAASPAGAAALDLPAGLPVLEAAEALEALFQQHRLDLVAVSVGGRCLGATTRRLVQPPDPIRGIDAGDGPTLAGYSSAYELLEFRCGSCTAVTYRLHVDPRDPPACPNGHGPLSPAR